MPQPASNIAEVMSTANHSVVQRRVGRRCHVRNGDVGALGRK